MLHVEFTIDGPPYSRQSKSKRFEAWVESVRSTARMSWGDKPALTAGPLKCSIYYVHEGPTARRDDDNMAKPIRDALSGIVYQDDKLIHHSTTTLMSLDAPIKASGVSLVILSAYNRGRPFVYVWIEDAPTLYELPG
jgi:Holliday junction resolvase RusA-like endonuclease